MENNNEKLDWQIEVMPETIKRIQKNHEQQKAINEALEKWKLKRIKEQGIAIGLAIALAAGGMAITIGRRNMGVKPQPTVITEEDGNVRLGRTYEIQFGDTLSGLSNKTGIPVKTIQKDNEISNPNEIYMNQKLILNYSIDPEDLEYYTQTASIDGRSLDAIATEYDTTVSTLLELNDGKFDRESNTIIVPNFITPSELAELKQSHHK